MAWLVIVPSLLIMALFMGAASTYEKSKDNKAQVKAVVYRLLGIVTVVLMLVGLRMLDAYRLI